VYLFHREICEALTNSASGDNICKDYSSCLAKRTDGMDLITRLGATQWALGKSVVCLGYFDGVHLGHQALLRQGKTIAIQNELLLCVHTYDIPPIKLLKPDLAYQELCTFEEKCGLLEAAGADVVAVSRFDWALMHMSGADFFDRVVVEGMQAQHIVVGYDHRFGFMGDTGVDELHALCHAAGIGLSVIEAVLTSDGRVISSSAVRAAIKAEDWAQAQILLGRPYP
jgi:riboflavin kinase/FMN adenylyltransferase